MKLLGALQKLFLCYYSCPNFSHIYPSTQPTSHSHSQSPHHCPCSWAIHICSLTSPFAFFQPVTPKTAVSLSHVSMSDFILLVRFHLYVRSYGICPSPTGLFHLASWFPGSSMLSKGPVINLAHLGNVGYSPYLRAPNIVTYVNSFIHVK